MKEPAQDLTKLRIRVAELCGWQEVFVTNHVIAGVPKGMPVTDDNFTADMPDWVTDLNACHEFEKTLTDEQIGEYINQLRIITGGRAPTSWGWLSIKDAWILATAAAEQRCRALVATIGAS